MTKRLILAGLAAFALAAIAACDGRIYLRDGVTDGDTFYISPAAAANSDPVVQAWIRYSLARSVCQLDLTDDNPARASSFDCELTSRRQLAGAWQEYTLANPSLRDDYLDDLRFVANSGFLPEYVAEYFARRHWQLPDDLDRREFNRWRQAEFRGHQPKTRIIGSWGYSKASLKR